MEGDWFYRIRDQKTALPFSDDGETVLMTIPENLEASTIEIIFEVNGQVILTKEKTIK